MQLPPALFRLVALPFERARYVGRVEGIVARYAAMLRALDANSTSARRRLEVELVYTHPSAWQELEGLTREVVVRRMERARNELTALRAAAPIPAPKDREERTLVLALADFEWLARHTRTLARRKRRFGIAAALDHHVSSAQDPIDGLDALLVEALTAIPRGERHGALRKVVAVRHHCPAFEAAAVKKPAPPPVGRVVVGPFEALREGRAKRVEIGERMIAVFKHEGRLRAIEDTCPHRGGPLGKGEIDEHGCVRCPLHGWPFDLATGRMRGNENISVKTFESGVDDDGNIWIGSEST